MGLYRVRKKKGGGRGEGGAKRGSAFSLNRINRGKKRYIPPCHVQSPLWLLETSYCSSQLLQMANLPLYLFFPVDSSPSLGLGEIGLSGAVLSLATTLDDGFFGISSGVFEP